VNQQSVLKLSFHISQAETFIVSEKIGSTAMAKDKSSADGRLEDRQCGSASSRKRFTVASYRCGA
jgi:hypothetical protein